MASKAGIIAVLILCSVLVSSNAGGHGGGAVQDVGTIFNVLNYGAKPNSKQESTQEFVRAWTAACNFNGKARLLIPPGVYQLGEVVFQGPCKSTAPITVLLQGTLQAVSDPSYYTGKGWISIDDVNGIVLTGGGTIDGQGQNIWPYNDCKTNSECVHMPASLYIVGTSNAKIKSIKFLNSMGFHMHITRSNMIRLHSLTITAPGDSPNTDGMHISQSNTVKVARSVIGTGDDCVSIGQGSTNVTVNKVTCGPGHGIRNSTIFDSLGLAISVGSLGKVPDEKDVQGLIVQNCTLVGTTNGLRIKTYQNSQPSKASAMLFKDIIMNNVKNPIVIDQNYGSRSSKALICFQKLQPSLVKISDVFYQNIKGTTISEVAVDLSCSPQVPCQNVRLHNINLQFIGNEKLTSTCTNAKVGYSGIQIPPPC